jgi:hypothetical protein
MKSPSSPAPRLNATIIIGCPIGSRLFTLQLGDVAKAICASTGYQDVQRARAILSESPNGHFTDAWLSERLPGFEYQLPIIVKE